MKKNINYRKSTIDNNNNGIEKMKLFSKSNNAKRLFKGKIHMERETIYAISKNYNSNNRPKENKKMIISKKNSKIEIDSYKNPTLFNNLNRYKRKKDDIYKLKNIKNLQQLLINKNLLKTSHVFYIKKKVHSFDKYSSSLGGSKNTIYEHKINDNSNISKLNNNLRSFRQSFIENKNIKNIDKKNIKKRKPPYETEKNEKKNEDKEKKYKNSILETKIENKKESNIVEENKNDVPVLNLEIKSNEKDNSEDDDVSYKQYSITSANESETEYDSDGLNIKGEHMNKIEKREFLNNLKKCLFNPNAMDKQITINEKKIERGNEHINLKENISMNESLLKEMKPKIISSVLTQAGISDEKVKTNQDSYLLIENLFDLYFHIYGIFDGHGVNGHLISNLVSQFLVSYFQNKKNFIKNDRYDESETESEITESLNNDLNINNEYLEQILSSNDKFIKGMIKKLEEKSNECNFSIDYSGTTCTLLIILENKLICSNIGDSQCILFSCSNEQRWSHEVISKIHKPDDPEEYQRIIENGGVIHPYYDENGVYEGPNRVYAKNKVYPGLCITRSIGDLVGGEIGIISEPDIIIKKIDSTCKYLVLGSDGLWDMVKPYDIIRIVNPFFSKGDVNGACNALLKRANKNWEKDDSERDDITIIVVFLGKP